MINNVVIMGRLTADPELRTTGSGKEVTSFAVAVDRSYVKPGEERQADFINVVAWNSTAKFVCDHFMKGSLIALRGAIQTRRYEDKDGNKRTAFEVVASEVSFCGSRSENRRFENSVPDETPQREASFSVLPGEGYPFEGSMDDDGLPF